MKLPRRTFVASVLLLPILSGCETVPGLGRDESVRRLLQRSTERAFARLARENGFVSDELARISLPAALAAEGASLAPDLQRRLEVQLNRAAEHAAGAAASVMAAAIGTLAIPGAVSILESGGTAATDYLQRNLGGTLFEALASGVGGGLRLNDAEAVTAALVATDTINFEGLRLDVARQASDAIYRAIGREEAAIRADPRVLRRVVGAFGPLF